MCTSPSSVSYNIQVIYSVFGVLIQIYLNTVKDMLLIANKKLQADLWLIIKENYY